MKTTETSLACCFFLVFGLVATAIAGEDAAAAKAAASLLKNGDFEASPAGAESKGKVPPGWTQSPITFLNTVEIATLARPGSTGKQCLKVAGTAEFPGGGLFSEMLPVDPSKPLQISGWLRPADGKTDAGGMYAGVGWYDKDRQPVITRKGTTMNYAYLAVRESVDRWTHVEYTFGPAPAQPRDEYNDVIPPGTAFASVWLFTSNYPATAYYDDFEATQTPSVPEVPAAK